MTPPMPRSEEIPAILQESVDKWELMSSWKTRHSKIQEDLVGVGVNQSRHDGLLEPRTQLAILQREIDRISPVPTEKQ